jgi:hypothetical protein
MHGDTHRATNALRALRHRWHAPSRPLAVDDEPHWTPAADPASDDATGDVDSDAPGIPPVAA